MEEAQTIPLGMLMLGCLFILPVIGLAIILLIRRSESLRSLAPAILLAAVTSSLLATCLGVPVFTVTNRPYGAPFPWLSILRNAFIFLYVGFGIGAALATLMAIPAFFVNKWFRSRSEGPKPPTLAMPTSRG